MQPRRFLIILLLLSVNLSAQDKPKLDEIYEKYFHLPRVIPHLHLNKTSFLQGEEVWFKAYIVDQNKNKLNDITSNLICTIHDEEGNEIARKLVFIDKGIGQGSFLLDTVFNKKTYYLKASTNWMKNFKEDQTFLQKINIVRNFNKKAKKTKVLYDVQILPEGGHLVEGVKSMVGVVIKNSNHEGIKVDNGIVVNETGNNVGSFKTNLFGHGKFSLSYRKSEKYFLEFTINGEKIKKEIPLAKERGYVLNVSSSSNKYLRIILKTNYNTLIRSQHRTVKVLIHNTKFYLLETIKLNPSYRDYDLFVEREKLKKGINIVTLFDHENKPLSERIVFNYSEDLFETVSIGKSAIANDSITFSFQKKETDKASYYLSASFLPEGTKAYNSNNNIYASILLRPYVRGHIQNARYYFQNTNKQKLQYLDLLLLNQGWSKYKWNNVFHNTPKPVFENERGITIKGKLNIPEKRLKGKLSLIAPNDNVYVSKKLRSLSYEFKHLYLRENSRLILSYLKKKKEIKPNGYLRFTPSVTKEKIFIPPSKEIERIEDTTAININKFLVERELLDEIKLKSDVQFNNRPIVALGHTKGVKISDHYSDHINLLDIITSNGFLVDGFAFADNGNPQLLIYERQHYHLRNALMAVNPRSSPPRLTQVFLNDLDITSSTRQLLYIKADNIDEVFFNRTENGRITIFTKKREDMNISIPTATLDYIIPNGFATEKEYYNPNYSSYRSPVFKKYGAIFWNPSIELSKKKDRAQVKVPVHHQNSISIFLEGITSEGKLISIKKTLDIK
ncbi:hypothetical protein [Pseudotenacibaculum haliotis]|uniref:Macroglobulin domain-containing protein n=1 Tax=Pseudotenacibaculum haliotis TaxID=1862138 RepID=A0ABW5LQ37_9FLAO